MSSRHETTNFYTAVQYLEHKKIDARMDITWINCACLRISVRFWDKPCTPEIKKNEISMSVLLAFGVVAEGIFVYVTVTITLLSIVM